MITIGNNLEYRHFKYFLAVADELHYGKAAQKLYISQPGLSRQIKQLEELLDLSLFNRHNRKVELTAAGKFLKGKLKQHFQELNSTLEEAKNIYDGIEGNLHFGYVGSAMQNIIPNTLKKFRKNHPKVLLELKEMDNNQQVEALINNKLDIGFVRLEEVPKEVQMHTVLQETFSLVIPKNHEINSSNFQGLHQFKEEDFIMFDPSYSPTYYNKISAIFQQSGFSPKTMHKTVNASTIYKLVENGFGVSIVPTSLQKGYNLEVDFIELTNIPQRTSLSAIWLKKNQNPMLKELLELL